MLLNTFRKQKRRNRDKIHFGRNIAPEGTLTKALRVPLEARGVNVSKFSTMRPAPLVTLVALAALMALVALMPLRYR